MTTAIELLQGIISLADDGRKSLERGDTLGMLDCLDLIEGDIATLRKQFENAYDE